jgi:nicotinamide mononucleotide transporter
MDLAPLLAPAFVLWGSPVTVLELVAVVLSLGMVIGNLRVKVWAWPLAILASACYGVLFSASQLYGEAGLQVVFIAVSLWGWLQWQRQAASGSDHSTRTEAIRTLTRRQRWQVLLVTLMAWPLLGSALRATTNTDVPFADALPTVASITGQLLLAAKRVETWWFWLAVNAYSIGLFAYKALWPTAMLYAVFLLMSWWGLQSWQRLIARHG